MWTLFVFKEIRDDFSRHDGDRGDMSNVKGEQARSSTASRFRQETGGYREDTNVVDKK